ncbi:hypothetical protein [Sphingomonas sp. R86521]|uniref:hypothetical protein n=1 Tax=Sphingomonas sp. R86521 TaxID=3093860 RepID=UPI0036D21B18
MASHTTVATDVATGRGISVGNVFGRSANVIKANPLATLGTSFGLIALPQIVLGQIGLSGAVFQNVREGRYALVGVYAIIVGLLWLIASGALVQATVAHHQGRPANPQEMLQVGVSRCLPLFAVYLLLLIGVWVGTIFLIVPGIMLAVMWSVSLPAIVAERPGVFGAFGRSQALTKGARWHVFGILLLACVIYLLVSIAIGVASVAGYGSLSALTGGGQVQMPVPTQPSLIVQLLQSIITTVVLTWFTTVGAALFIELRDWKEGPDAERLADIFA